MPNDTAKAKARKQRYLDRKKAEKYGTEAVGVDMRGRHGNHPRGSRHGRWNNDRIVSQHGYAKVRVGRDHPLADPNGYAYEHLIVWVAAGRSMPNQDEVIHHRNEDKQDNRIENLELLTRSMHGEHHIADRERDNAGRLLDGREWNEFPEV